jgi:hypothetical protein
MVNRAQVKKVKDPIELPSSLPGEFEGKQYRGKNNQTSY